MKTMRIDQPQIINNLEAVCFCNMAGSKSDFEWVDVKTNPISAIVKTKGNNNNSIDNCAEIISSDYYAQIGSNDDDAQIVSSGHFAQISSSGDRAQIVSNNDSVHISSSGDSAQIISNSDSAQIGSSGDSAKIESTGETSVICCSGVNSIAKAKKGSWITLAEWMYSEGKGRYIPVCVKTEYVDGKRIKEDTWYKLVDGKFIETNKN